MQEINKSLSALGNCINALTDARRSHVPFRDSKLTYLLKDSLGGNTKTTLLVTCSPHPANSDETMSSLTFAQATTRVGLVARLLFPQRAAHVKNRVRINRQLSVQELQQLVARLKKQLSQSQAKYTDTGSLLRFIELWQDSHDGTTTRESKSGGC